MKRKEIFHDWLVEGFSNLDDSPKKNEPYKGGLIPLVLNEGEKNIAPKPLFPVFLNDVEFDRNFTVEYLEVIQNSLKLEKDKFKKLPTDTKMPSANCSFVNNKRLYDIDYERKNIFLSRLIFPLFEIADTFVSKSSIHYHNVVYKNKLYEKALEMKNNCPQIFSEQSIQVGILAMEEKQLETVPIINEDKKFLVNSFLMKNYYDRKEVYVKPSFKTFEQFIDSRTTFRDFKEFMSKLSVNSDTTENIRNTLYSIEKTLDYNTYENTIISFNNSKFPFKSKRNSKIRESESEVVQPNIHLHLKFQLPILNNGYHVTCLESSLWNPSIFICGYGVPSSEVLSYDPRGMVLCWNIHKSGYPERIYYMEEVVTCIEISRSKPYLVAVGMCYGLIAIIDLRLNNSMYITNKTSNKRPIHRIKSVKWIMKKYSLDKELEILLAISTNGVVTSWVIARSLKGNVLTTLTHKDTEFNKKRKNFLTNAANSVCMQIKPDDQDILSIGTSEGDVFFLNFTKPDDNVKVQKCHFGSLNDLKWSPLTENVFVTCGTDRCLHIWETHKPKPSKTIILPENILAVTLSAIKSTLFCAMTKSKLFIYDLATNLHKAIIELDAINNSDYTFVTFCPYNNWILVGHTDGLVTLYEIMDLSAIEPTKSTLLKNIFLPS